MISHWLLGNPSVKNQLIIIIKYGQITVWLLAKLSFGANRSPYILNAVLRLHLSEEQKKADECKLQLIQLLKDSFYADDCISSVPDVDEAESFRTFSMNLLKKAGMELCKWLTNYGLQSESGLNKVLRIVW